MANKSSPLLPSTNEILRKLGERIFIARKRRKLTAEMVARRAGMSPITLRNVEAGESGVTIGSYIAAMQVLGMEKDFNLIAQKDELGRDLQDARLIKPQSYVKLKSGRIPAKSPNKDTQMTSKIIAGHKESLLAKNQSQTDTISGEQMNNDSMKTSFDLASLIKPRTAGGKNK